MKKTMTSTIANLWINTENVTQISDTINLMISDDRNYIELLNEQMCDKNSMNDACFQVMHALLKTGFCIKMILIYLLDKFTNSKINTL